MLERLLGHTYLSDFVINIQNFETDAFLLIAAGERSVENLLKRLAELESVTEKTTV